MDNPDYNFRREKELKWLRDESNIEHFRNCMTLDEVENLYRMIYTSLYSDSVRLWMGGKKGAHFKIKK